MFGRLLVAVMASLLFGVGCAADAPRDPLPWGHVGGKTDGPGYTSLAEVWLGSSDGAGDISGRDACAEGLQVVSASSTASGVVAQGTHWVGEAVTVPEGESLTIARGVCVEVSRILVRGELRIEGSQNDPVHLREVSIQVLRDRTIEAKWAFLEDVEISGALFSRVILRHVSHAGRHAPATAEAGLIVGRGSHIELADVLMGPAAWHGIYAREARIDIRDSRVLDVAGSPVVSDRPRSVALRNSQISGFDHPIQVGSMATPAFPTAVHLAIEDSVIEGQPARDFGIVEKQPFSWRTTEYDLLEVWGSDGYIARSVVRAGPGNGILLHNSLEFAIDDSEITGHAAAGIVADATIPAGLGPCEIPEPTPPPEPLNADPVISRTLIARNQRGVVLRHPLIKLAMSDSRVIDNATGVEIEAGSVYSPALSDDECYRPAAVVYVEIASGTRIRATDFIDTPLAIQSKHRLGVFDLRTNYWQHPARIVSNGPYDASGYSSSPLW